MTKARDIADLLDTNGDIKSGALDNVPNEVAVSASAPSSPSEGDLWYDTANEILKIYNNTSAAFVKVSPQIPTISSTSGSITKETSTTLTLTGSNFLNSCRNSVFY